MPGTDEVEVKNQEPSNEENETEEKENEGAGQYEDRVTDTITGVIGSEEEDD
jgi:hypothetical protein